MAGETDVRASARFVLSSPRKVRLVVDQVRGRPAQEALDLLRFSPKAAALPVSKVIRSAMANAEQNFGMNPEDLIVAGIWADEGPPAAGAVSAPAGVSSRSCGGRRTSPSCCASAQAPRAEAREGAGMGRKVHPIGFRLKITKPWRSRWFANRSKYADQLHEDRAIRELINRVMPRAGIGSVEIERFTNNRAHHDQHRQAGDRDRTQGSLGQGTATSDRGADRDQDQARHP